VSDLPAEVDSLAQRIAEQLMGSERPLVLSGSSCGSSSVIEAAANVAYALHGRNPNTRICFAVPWCNSMGLGLMGHKSVESVIQAIKSGKATTVIVLEDNVYRHLDTVRADDLLHAAHRVIAIDHLHHQTTAKSFFVLPAATFAESTGTFVNNEGRAQRFFRVFNPSSEVRDSWRWIGDIMVASGKSDSPPWPTYDDIVTNLAQEMPALAPIVRVSPPANFRMDDQLIPREPHRYSGRTAERAAMDVHEPQTPPDPDSPLSFSMEGYSGQPPSPLIPEFWAPKWNSVQSVNKYQDGVGGSLRGGNPGIRLIEPHQAGLGPGYFAHIPPAFARREGCLLIVPGYHVFGSEELSIASPAVAELAAKPGIAVSPEDIGSLIVDEDGLVEVAFSHISHHLPVRLAPGVPRGLAVVPMGLPGVEWNGLPVWKRLLRS
jgi:NADH-quinone oxidoreductase subunit G